MNAVECELHSNAVAVVGQQAGLAQFGLCESQSVEREFVKVGVVRYPPLVEVQRQWSLVWAPNADVVAGLPAAGQVEVDLQAEFFLGHDQFPEEAVARSLPGYRTVPQVVSGAQPVAQLPGCAHCAGPRRFTRAVRVVGTCTASAWPRLSTSSADRNELFSRLRTKAFFVDLMLSSEFCAMVSASSIAASSA